MAIMMKTIFQMAAPKSVQILHVSLSPSLFHSVPVLYVYLLNPTNTHTICLKKSLLKTFKWNSPENFQLKSHEKTIVPQFFWRSAIAIERKKFKLFFSLACTQTLSLSCFLRVFLYIFLLLSSLSFVDVVVAWFSLLFLKFLKFVHSLIQIERMRGEQLQQQKQSKTKIQRNERSEQKIWMKRRRKKIECLSLSLYGA